LFRQGDNFHTAYCIEKGDTISLPCDPVLPR
jgi:hypothetical protein